MTLHYRYRWLYAVILTTILQLIGFFYGLNPAWLQIAGLKRQMQNNRQMLLSLLQDEKNQAQIKTVKKRLIVSSAQSQSELIFDLISLANIKGLNLGSLQLLLSKDQSILLLHLILLGSYSRFLDFARRIEETRYPVTILDFDYKPAQNNQNEFTMDIAILKAFKIKIERRAHTQINLPKTYNPFCASEGGLQQMDHIHVQTVPLLQLKMVGYVEQDHHVFALLALPNHRIKEVSLGEVIGREQGVVIQISQNKIDVRMPDGHLCNIKMQSEALE